VRANHAFPGELAIRADVHVGGRCERRRLSVIECGNPTVRHPNDHISATAEITGLGKRDGERETRCNRGVNGISTLLHDLGPDGSRQTIVARNDRVLSERRLPSGGQSPRRWKVRRHTRRNRGPRRSVVVGCRADANRAGYTRDESFPQNPILTASRSDLVLLVLLTPLDNPFRS
jgi:hypothetical protein